VWYDEMFKSFTVCDQSGEDPKCSDQFKVDVNPMDHDNYLSFNCAANLLMCKLP
jgi:hypothetical protein